MPTSDPPQREVTMEELKAYASTVSGPLSLIVDVGGTNCRLGLRPAGPRVLETHFVKVPVMSVKSFHDAAIGFATRLGEAVTKRIVAACVSVPGPISQSGARGGPISNFGGATLDEKVVLLDALPSELFPKGRTTLLNDLEAGAYGIMALQREGQLDRYFTRMWIGSEQEKGSKPSLTAAHSVLLAPGTGLGTAIVHFDRLQGRHRVMPLEFGHTSVQSLTHRDVLKDFRHFLSRGQFEVEYDDTCSGRGIEFFYRRIKSTAPDAASPSAGKVCALASEGDRDALAAMRMYYTFLMRIASQLAMGVCPEQVILMGDNMVSNAFYFNDDTIAAMQRTFKDHSMERMGYLSRVGVMRQVKLLNVNLAGCAFVSEMQRQTQASKL